MTDAQRLRDYAKTILEERKRRTALFPPEIFDEYAWEMMLGIFAHGKPMSDYDLIAAVGCNTAVGLRWLDHLADQRQVIRSGQTPSLVDLCGDARAAIYSYLAASLNRAVVIEEAAP